jgi:hypothetical protein
MTCQDSPGEDEWLEELSSTTGLQADVNAALEELLGNVETYLQRLNRDRDLLPLEAVQAYITADQEYSAKLWSTFQSSIKAGSVQSSSHHCLMSELGPDYAALCIDKQHLMVRHAQALKQTIMAKVAKAKVEAQIKQLEQSLQSVSKDKHLSAAEVLLATSQLKDQVIELTPGLKALSALTDSICSLKSQLFAVENELELRDNSTDLVSSLSQAVLNELTEQKKRHLAVFSLVLLEQKEVQGEYDELHLLEVELEELAIQADFRVQQYQDSKLKAEMSADRRKTVDQRDELLTAVWKAAGGGTEDLMSVTKLKDMVKLRVKQAKDARSSRLGQFADWLAQAQA